VKVAIGVDDRIAGVFKALGVDMAKWNEGDTPDTVTSAINAWFGDIPEIFRPEFIDALKDAAPILPDLESARFATQKGRREGGWKSVMIALGHARGESDLQETPD
jgi:hypothetical protein